MNDLDYVREMNKYSGEGDSGNKAELEFFDLVFKLYSATPRLREVWVICRRIEESTARSEEIAAVLEDAERRLHSAEASEERRAIKVEVGYQKERLDSQQKVLAQSRKALAQLASSHRDQLVSIHDMLRSRYQGESAAGSIFD